MISGEVSRYCSPCQLPSRSSTTSPLSSSICAREGDFRFGAEHPPTVGDFIMGRVGDDTGSGIAPKIVPRSYGAQFGMTEFPLRLFPRPLEPFLRDWISRVEDEAPIGSQMSGDRGKHRLSIFWRQKHLEGVPGQNHQVEASSKPDVARIGLDPVDPLPAGSAARDVEHRRRRIDAGHAAPIGERRRQLPGTAAEIENRARVLGKADAISRSPRRLRSRYRRTGRGRDRCKEGRSLWAYSWNFAFMRLAHSSGVSVLVSISRS